MDQRTDTAEIRSALHSTNPEDRDWWVTAGMAVHSALGAEGREIWFEWSRQSEKFNERDAAAVWRSFRPGRIGIGSLFHRAKVNGWQPRRQWKPWKPDPNARHSARKRQEQEARHRAQQAKLAAKQARSMLDEAEYREHPYFARKGLARVNKWKSRVWPVSRKGDLLVPVNRLSIVRGRVVSGDLMAVQAISAKGRKLFLPRGAMVSAGGFVLGGRGIHGVWYTWLCEGFATALSIRAALNMRTNTQRDQVVIAFSAHNLGRLGLHCNGRMRARIVADNDPPSSTGKQAGLEAARKSGLPYFMPPVQGTDANDFHQRRGLDALRNELLKVRAQA